MSPSLRKVFNFFYDSQTAYLRGGLYLVINITVDHISVNDFGLYKTTTTEWMNVVIYTRRGTHNLAPSWEKLLLTTPCADTIYGVIKYDVSMALATIFV